MSYSRGNGQNGGHFYSNITQPVKIDCNFVVDSTNGNGLGIRSLKSNGYIEHVYMNTSAGAPAGTPAMGTSRSFAVLGASAVTNTGSSVLTGNLGIYPGTAVTGFPPGTFSGQEHVADVPAQSAQASALAAYTDLQARTPTGISSVLDGQSLTAGVYKATSGTAGTFALAASGNGTLTLTGSATDIFVFQTTTTLTTGAGGTPTITLAGGALASNVYWVVGSSATINSGFTGVFNGNIIALTSITDTLGGTVNGSLIALNGAVTLSAASTINVKALTAVPATGNPNPLPGYAWINFKNNYNYYLGGFSGFVSPLSGTNVAINSTSLVVGQAYVISVLGTSTLADWQAIGLPKGFTPTVGQSFIAIKSGNGSGSGKVQVPSVSGVDSVEVIGDPNQMISNSSIAANAGAWVLVQFLLDGILTAPANNSVVGMSFFFDASSVTIDGL